MINRGFLAMLLVAFALVTQNCSNKKETQSEMILKITNSEEFTSFVNDYNSGKFHINDSLISPLVVTLDDDISIINDHLHLSAQKNILSSAHSTATDIRSHVVELGRQRMTTMSVCSDMRRTQQSKV